MLEHTRKGLFSNIYAQLIKFDSIWFDDDLRADCHSVGDSNFADPLDFGCYCDTCIGEFNKLHNTHYTREELVREVTYGNPEIRKQYVNFCRDGIGDFVEYVTKAIHEVSPDTIMAHQFAHWGNYMGQDDNHVLDAIYHASGKPPMVRPGGGYYHDKEPLGQFKKALEISLANSVLPSYVKDRKAEVENLPNVAFGKSVGGTVSESTMHLAYGCTGLTYTIMYNTNEDISRQERMLKYFSRVHPYWKKLSALSKETYRGGISIFHGEAPHLRKLREDELPFDWANISYSKDIKLLIVGMPITHEQDKTCAYLLHHDMIDTLNDNDIEFLLSKPVITDAQSVQMLYERGYADRFRLKLNLSKAPGSTCEMLKRNHPVNRYATMTRFYDPINHFPVPMTKYIIEANDDSTEFLGINYHTVTNEALGGATVIAGTFDKAGNRESSWLISGYCVWSDIISSSKRNQLLNGIDYISPLPAKLVSAEQCVVIPCINNKNKTAAVTIASASIGETEELEVIVRNPAGSKISVMSSKCREIEPISISQEPDGLKVVLPELMPYEIITVFAEQE